MPETAGPPGLLAVIAGRGQLPLKIAEARANAGLPYLLVVFQDCFEPWMADHPFERHEFERAGAVFRSLRTAGATHVVFAGAMMRPRLKPWRADLKAMGLFARALALLRQGDDAMLRGLGRFFEAEGMQMIGPYDILGSDMTVPAGQLGRIVLSADDKADAARAAAIVEALGPLDVGQGAIVARGLCLAVEAIEGTDLMLARLAGLPAERRAPAPPPCGVLYKGPKPGQDLRMDMPVIGAGTVKAAKKAGLNGIVALADRTILMDADATRETADRLSLAVYGATEGELQTWAR